MYHLYYAPDNASMIIRLALLEADAPFDTVLVNRQTRDQDAPAYRALNPAGLIPCLITPEGPLSETGAILLYLVGHHPALMPKGPQQHFLQWLFFLSNTAHADMRQLFYPHEYSPIEGRKGHHSLLTQRMKRHFALLDKAAQQNPDLFAPPSPLALYLCALLRWSVLYTGGDDWFSLQDYPAFHNLARAMEARPSVQALIKAEGLGQTPFSAPHPCRPPEGSAI